MADGKDEMSATTKIEWTDSTWNPVTGCTRVSEGCRNCYMARTVPRQGLDPWKVVLHHDRLDQPLKWKKPRRIFVNSLSDLFHDDVPFEFIHEVYATMRQSPQHTYQILTKRPKRMMECVSRIKSFELMGWAKGFYSHVWLGVSIENQETADERIPLLLQTPAAKRFVSAEPLLGPIDLTRIPVECGGVCALRGARPAWHPLDWVIAGGESGPGARPMHPDWARSIREQCQAAGVPFFFKQWGEWKPISEMSQQENAALYVSNRKAREHENQADVDDCYGMRCTKETSCIRHDGAAFAITDPGAFEMRNGHPAMTTFRVGKKTAGAMLDGREHKEWPEDLRVREFPTKGVRDE